MSYPNAVPEASSPLQQDHGQGYLSSETEKAQLRATSLYLIQSIVERHGGTTDIDLATNTINIDVPEGEEAVCAKEIEAQIGRMYQ